MIVNVYFDAILSKFPDGKEKYNNSVLFRSIIDSLVFSNITPYECIDKLISMVEDTKKSFQEYAESDYRPTIINGNHYEIILK